jgi:hypothetical protein
MIGAGHDWLLINSVMIAEFKSRVGRGKDGNLTTLIFTTILINKENRPEYYKNIKVGENYYFLNYDKCVPFLTMLPRALTLFVNPKT